MNETTAPEWGDEVEGFKWMRQRFPHRGGSFYIYKSNRDKTSLGTSDPEEAKVRYVERIGQPTVEGDKQLRCNAAFEIFLRDARLEPATHAKYRGLWEHWAKRSLGTKRVAEVKPVDIIATIREAKAGVSPKTGRPLSEHSLRQVYVCLSSFFAFCTEEGEAKCREDNPVAKIGKTNRPAQPVSGAIADEVVASSEEIEEISAWIINKANMSRRDERVRAIVTSTIVLVMPWTGARLGEVLGLKVTDWNRVNHQLDPENFPFEEITIERQVNRYAVATDPTTWYTPLKGKKGTVGDTVRVVPLLPEVVGILDAYVQLGLDEGWLEADGPLFPNAVGRPNVVAHISTHISTAAKAVLGRRYTSHFFRHTFASRILEQGGTVSEAAELLGNSEKVCAAVYAHRGNRRVFNTRVIGYLQAAKGTG